MKQVKLENGYAETKVNDKLIVRCTLFNDNTYGLRILNYGNRFLHISTICDGVKRISTINKYAKEYGVVFVA